jgi:hypothetical protein
MIGIRESDRQGVAEDGRGFVKTDSVPQQVAPRFRRKRPVCPVLTG